MKIQMDPLTKSIVLSAICVSALFFTLYSMKKNDRVVVNKFLYIKGFALSTGLLCLIIPDLAYIGVKIGVLPTDYSIQDAVENFYHPYVILMVASASLAHAGYLFSLKNRCWRFENILYSLKKKFYNFTNQHKIPNHKNV